MDSEAKPLGKTPIIQLIVAHLLKEKAKENTGVRGVGSAGDNAGGDGDGKVSGTADITRKLLRSAVFTELGPNQPDFD